MLIENPDSWGYILAVSSSEFSRGMFHNTNPDNVIIKPITKNRDLPFRPAFPIDLLH